jgi:hypothetical protein
MVFPEDFVGPATGRGLRFGVFNELVVHKREVSPVIFHILGQSFIS